MSPIVLVFLLCLGTLNAYPHMYTVPCPLTQGLSEPPMTPSNLQPQNYNPYPMKIIVTYPQNSGQNTPCSGPQNSDRLSPGDLGSVAGILKLPGVLADKLLAGEISLK